MRGEVWTGPGCRACRLLLVGAHGSLGLAPLPQLPLSLVVPLALAVAMLSVSQAPRIAIGWEHIFPGQGPLSFSRHLCQKWRVTG